MNSAIPIEISNKNGIEAGIYKEMIDEIDAQIACRLKTGSERAKGQRRSLGEDE